MLLSGAGLNLSLAPVLDGFRTPADFDDQFQRSFSSDPDVVSVCGTSLHQGTARIINLRRSLS